MMFLKGVVIWNPGTLSDGTTFVSISSDEVVKYSYMNTSSVKLKGILLLP
jgi:WD40 repeat protein